MDYLLSAAENQFYNVSWMFSVYKCTSLTSTPQTDPEDPDVVVENELEDVFETVVSGPSVLDQIKETLGFGPDVTPAPEEIHHAQPNTQKCVKLFDISEDWSFLTSTLVYWMLLVMMTVLIGFVVWTGMSVLVKYLNRKRKVPSEEPDSPKAETSRADLGTVGAENISNSYQEFMNQVNNFVTKSPISLAVNKGKVDESIKVNYSDAKSFLAVTIDKFLVEIDKSLGISSEPIPEHPAGLSSSASSGAISNLASPRLQRRSTWRRPRLGSPSLPLGDLSLLRDSQLFKDRCAWIELEKMNHRLGWFFDPDDIDFGMIENRCLKDVLTFHIRNCPINTQQWIVASLIVNYTLLLLEKELLHSAIEEGVRFIEFKGIGSVAKGLKISRLNQFDVAMIMQPNDCLLNSVLHHSACEDVPAGSLVLSVKDVKQNRKPNPCLKKASVGKFVGTYLLPKEVLTLSRELINQAVHRLLTNNKNVIDRLPFSFKTGGETDLQLIIDTRVLHGLGLGIPEICIRLCPAISLVSPTLSMLPVLYAVPPWHAQQLQQKRRSSSSSSIRIFRDSGDGAHSDLLWKLSFFDLEASYLSAMDQKLKLAGVSGCHRLCLKIMKGLFTSGHKTSLLSRGEIQSYQLETIMYFLLLESAPSSWGMVKLADRVSDCIHFLKSAFQSTWLPSFFVHNPHLVKHMPCVQMYPLLTVQRQDNLLANTKSETVEKILNFIEQRLQETGLAACVKDDFSSEMWEYEFFIFG